MSGAKAKRCAEKGCKNLPQKAERCWKHYNAARRAGVRFREPVGEDCVRRSVKLPKPLVKRLDAAVPKGGQGVWLREAVAEKLGRMKKATRECRTCLGRREIECPECGGEGHCANCGDVGVITCYACGGSGEEATP